MSNRVAVSIDQGIAQVTLSRADKRNALDMAMFQGIADAQRQLRRDRGVRAVILAGAGEDFCTGLDIRAILADRRSAIALLWKWLPWRSNLAQAVSIGWRELKVPVIAALQGRCWGGGLQVALGTDFRIAHPAASLSVMEGKWGLIPDMGGTLALRDIMPRDQAMRLAMTAEEISARNALDLGLVTAIHDEPQAAARDLARRITERSPDAVAAVKRLYRKSWGSGGLTLARETAYQIRILAGPNQRIAVKRQRDEDVDWRPAGHW